MMGRRSSRVWGMVAAVSALGLGLGLLGPIGAAGAENGLGERPYLGWSSWSLSATTAPGYGKGWINADRIKAQSAALAATLQPHGYTYINLDAGWRGGWDEHGRPVPDARAFPLGMKDLADAIHARGQRFGIYYVPGIDDDLAERNPTILGTTVRIREILAEPRRQGNFWGGAAIDFARPGANEYIRSIADLFAAWGVDFLKYDGVCPGSRRHDLSIDARPSVEAWGRALIRTGRPVWLTVSWGIDLKYHETWARHANAWRTGEDVESYDNLLTHWPQVAGRFDDARDHAWAAGRGRGWNDLDALLVGNGAMSGLTPDERRSAMTLWAVACSPLYSGDDLTKLDPLGLELLTNDEVIAVDQAGIPAQAVGGSRDVFSSRQADGSVVVALFNRDDRTERTVGAELADLGLAGRAEARDLWAHRDLGPVAGRLDAPLGPHACRLIRLTPAAGGPVR